MEPASQVAGILQGVDVICKTGRAVVRHREAPEVRYTKWLERVQPVVQAIYVHWEIIPQRLIIDFVNAHDTFLKQKNVLDARLEKGPISWFDAWKDQYVNKYAKFARHLCNRGNTISAQAMYEARLCFSVHGLPPGKCPRCFPPLTPENKKLLEELLIKIRENWETARTQTLPDTVALPVVSSESAVSVEFNEPEILASALSPPAPPSYAMSVGDDDDGYAAVYKIEAYLEERGGLEHNPWASTASLLQGRL